MKKPPLDLDLLNAFWWRTEAEKEWRLYRGAVRQARAFTLDDEAVEIIANMAFKGDPKEPATERRLDGYRSLARLPYPYMWIEYDYRVLDRWLTKKGIPHDRPVFGKPERVGYLLDRNPVEGVFRITTLGKMKDPTDPTSEIGAAMFPVSQTVTTMTNKLRLTPNPRASKAYQDAIVRGNHLGVSNAVAWGLMKPDDEYNLGDLGDVRDNALFETGSVEPEELWLAHSRDRGYDWVTIMRDSLIEQSLDLRFVIAALALLNHVPVRYVPYRRQGHARPRVEQRPFLSTSIITVEVPSSRRRIRDINDHLRGRAGGWHNRRHEVRGHWRTADEQVSEKWERFYDPMAEKYRWRLWIEGHERGDSSLGYVEQYHRVTASPHG